MIVASMTGAWTSSGGRDPSVILAAVEWIQDVLLGPVATSIAVMAISCVGLAMLSGRINVRRGATIIVGCFILFGAATIAQGFRGLISVGARDVGYDLPASASVEGLDAALTRPVVSSDPYAGAAVRR